jgi:hypothetical protein
MQTMSAFSGAAHSALYFVDDQQDAVLIANPPQLLHKTRGRGHIAAFALYRLDYDRCNLFRGRCGFEKPILDPIDRALYDATVATIVGAERIAIFVRIRHMDHVEHLSLESEALRGSG